MVASVAIGFSCNLAFAQLAARGDVAVPTEGSCDTARTSFRLTGTCYTRHLQAILVILTAIADRASRATTRRATRRALATLVVLTVLTLTVLTLTVLALVVLTVRTLATLTVRTLTFLLFSSLDQTLLGDGLLWVGAELMTVLLSQLLLELWAATSDLEGHKTGEDKDECSFVDSHCCSLREEVRTYYYSSARPGF